MSRKYFDYPPRVEKISEHIADCGCLEEIWVVSNLEMTIHFERDDEKGPFADAFVDAGEWDVENQHAGEPDVSRRDAIAFILSWPEES